MKLTPESLVYLAMRVLAKPGLLFLSLALVTAPVHAPGQQATAPSSAGIISVDAWLVSLPVIVRDKKGAIVQNLTKADFALSVDGDLQTIRYFDRDSDLPLTLGLLVDVSGSVRSALEDERSASEVFLEQMLRPVPETKALAASPASSADYIPDQAFLIQFAHETELLQGLTPSHSKLRGALHLIGTSQKDDQREDDTQQNDPSNGGYGQQGRRHHGGGRAHGGTTLYDAVFLSGDELMQKQHGRKALVVLTDGEDRGSKETLANAIEAAQRSETVIYAIYFKGEEHGGGHGGAFPGAWQLPGGGSQRGGSGESHVDGKKVLEQMAGETGGRLFEVKGKETFATIYTQIAEELRSQYRLGYTPDAKASASGYHRVSLSVPKEKKLIVQTRDGYYSRAVSDFGEPRTM